MCHSVATREIYMYINNQSKFSTQAVLMGESKTNQWAELIALGGGGWGFIVVGSSIGSWVELSDGFLSRICKASKYRSLLASEVQSMISIHLINISLLGREL